MQVPRQEGTSSRRAACKATGFLKSERMTSICHGPAGRGPLTAPSGESLGRDQTTSCPPARPNQDGPVTTAQLWGPPQGVILIILAQQ